MRILVVDDDKENQYLLKTMLEGSGYEMVAANNGKEALDKLRSLDIDIIISDILMPVMDGYQLCLECKKDDTLKKIFFVFYTATYIDKKDEELTYKLGADRFILKPLKPSVFLKIIQSVVEDIQKGKVKSRKPTFKEEGESYKLFSETLVKKLEKKMLDLKKEISKRKEKETELFRSNEKFQESEAKLSRMIELSIEGISLTDEYGIITLWNPSLENISGIKSPDVVGKPIWDIIYRISPPEKQTEAYKKKLKTTMRGFLATGKVPEHFNHLDKRYHHPDGSLRYQTGIVFVIKTEKGYILSSLTRDITKRKHDEEKIKHLNLTLRSIREVNKLIAKEKDPRELIRSVCEILTETRAYLNTWITLFDDQGKFLAYAEVGVGSNFPKMLDMLKNGMKFSCYERSIKQADVIFTKIPSIECKDCPLSNQYKNRSAMTVRIEYKDKIFGVISVSITEQLVADKEERDLLKELAGDIAFALHSIKIEDEQLHFEAKLMKNEQFLRGVFDAIQDGISVLDSDLNVINTNSWMERMYHAQMPVAGKKCYLVYQQRKSPCPWCPSLKTFQTGETHTEIVPYPSEKNPTGWIELTTFPLKDEQGRVTRVIEYVKDITESKKMEKELDKYRKYLEQLVKERTIELEEKNRELKRFNKLFVGREFRIKELKDQVQELEKESKRKK